MICADIPKGQLFLFWKIYGGHCISFIITIWLHYSVFILEKYVGKNSIYKLFLFYFIILLEFSVVILTYLTSGTFWQEADYDAHVQVQGLVK